MKSFINFFGIITLNLVSAHIEDISGVKWPTLSGKPTELFSHRGVKPHLPQHTIGGYWNAVMDGMDYLEPDLVLTKDGVPVCYHDLHIEEGTNVKELPEFDHLKRNFTGVIDNTAVTLKDVYFISDFTFKELSKVRVKQAVVGTRPQFYNQIFKIPSFQQFIDNAHHLSYLFKKPIKIVPEIKHAALHSSLRPENPRYFEDKVLEILRKNGYPLKEGDVENCQAKISKDIQDKCSPKKEVKVPCGKVVLQNFDFESLKYLTKFTHPSKVEHVALVDKYAWFYTPKGLDIVARYATWFSTRKDFHLNEIADEFQARNVTYDPKEVESLGGFIKAKDLIKECHQRNLKVVPYTFYDSREPANFGCKSTCFKGDTRDEFYYFFKMGADGMFVENLAEAVQLRTEFNTMLRFNPIV
ncbi:PLC-like phosphodiesterase [Neoconidiobolus thromboides FSU 785]|nr:PLC-like phosphodiesterase [Neoconidiobolus thromboides FSU 785]